MRVISFPVFNFLISTSPFDPEGISALPALLLKALCQSFFIRMICLARGMSSVDSGDCSLRSFGVSHRRFCTLRASTSQARDLYFFRLSFHANVIIFSFIILNSFVIFVGALSQKSL